MVPRFKQAVSALRNLESGDVLFSVLHAQNHIFGQPLNTDDNIILSLQWLDCKEYSEQARILFAVKRAREVRGIRKIREDNMKRCINIYKK